MWYDRVKSQKNSGSNFPASKIFVQDPVFNTISSFWLLFIVELWATTTNNLSRT